MSSEYDKSVIAHTITNSMPVIEHAFFEEGTLGGPTIVYGTLRYKERVGVRSPMSFLAAIRHEGWEFALEHSTMSNTTCYGGFKDKLHYTFAHHDPLLGDTPLKNLCAWLQKYNLLPAGELTACQLSDDSRAAALYREIMFCPPPVTLLNRLLFSDKMHIVKGKLSLAVFDNQDDMLHWYALLPGPVKSVRLVSIPVHIIKTCVPDFPQDTPDDAAMVGVAFSKEEDLSDCRLQYWATFGV